MHNTLRAAIAVTLVVVVAPASAVVLNPRGTGQVLIYPYYTVNAGNGTLLSVVNTTDKGKALKVRFLEGYNGRDVLSFNLYLSPFDVWVAQTFDTSSDGTGVAAVASNDNSCTVPVFPGAEQGPKRVSFRDAGYSGTNNDGGPTGLDRTREGYVEIIEMGEVTNASHGTLSAITHSSTGVPGNCVQVAQAWAPGGYWATDPTADLSVPGGGLYGSESIIDVAEGTLYTVNAEVIDGFSSTVQHTDPGNVAPDLNTASKSANATVSAFVPVGSGSVEAVYTNAEDAISALFMADAIYNEYVVDPNVGAMTDWIVTLPTKRYYTDPAFVGNAPLARKPFDLTFAALNQPGASSPIGPLFFDREESGFSCDSQCWLQVGYGLTYVTNAITFGSDASALGSNLRINQRIWTDYFGLFSGHMRISLTSDSLGATDQNHVLSSLNGVVFSGLPVIGFAATNYVNGNVVPGVLANFSGAFPQRTTVDCSNAANTEGACP